VQLVDPSASPKVFAESINQVAVGDLNGDGADDIVAGSNETYGAKSGSDVSFAGLLGGGAGQSTRVYAINGKTGAYLPGWPISISGVLQDTLPLIGPGADAALVQVGGQPRVLASATTGSLSTYTPAGALDKTMRQEDSSKGNATDKTPGLNLFESAAVGKLLPGTNPSAVKYEISTSQAANLLLVGQNVPYNHLIGAWDTTSGAAQPSFPTITDDYQFLSSSTVAKVNPSSQANQVLAGTGLGLLHAYDGATGLDAPGFPKTTGGWLFSPAALSNDGRMAGITREGYLFEWGSTAPACQSEWPTFRHDQQNSGNYDRDGTPPATPTGLALTKVSGGFQVTFKSPGDDGFCGNPTAYKATVDGQRVDLPTPVGGGQTYSKTVQLPAGAVLTVQAFDDQFNLGPAAAVALPGAGGGGGNGGNGNGGNGGNGNGGNGNGGNGNGGGSGNPNSNGCTVGKLPRSSISGRHLKASRRHISLSGRSREVDCKTGKLAVGKVKRVLVSIARIGGHGRCRFVRRNGRLGPTRRCSRPKYLSAHILRKRGQRNKTQWSLSLRVHLPRGSYVATVRGIDASGHRETISRSTNTKTFRLR
jgi:hypothetical protein